MRDAEVRRRSALLFYICAAAVVLIDQVSKYFARRELAAHKIVVIRGFFDLSLSYNPGGAFGILPKWTPLFVIIAIVTIYAIFRLRKLETPSWPLSAGLGLLLGGAIGNLIDRLLSPFGAVTDFLSFHLGGTAKALVWPTFNFADVAIVAGAVLLLYHVYVVERKRQE